MSTKPLVIIGSGLAAIMLAKEWRKHDHSTPLLLLTADTGDYYSKPQLSTALAQQKTAETLVINDAASLAQQLQAEVKTNTCVTAIDPAKHTVHYNDTTVVYQQLVLAVGAEKITPAFDHDAQVMSVNNLSDYRRFRQWLANKKQLAIVGAGLVGCEFANDLVNSGYQVTVLAMEQQPLAGLLPAPMAEHFTQALAAAGVNWCLGTTVERLSKQSNGYHLALANGHSVQADGVFAAIGLRPNLTLAKAAGLRVNHGIAVDRYCRTSAADIYALGDCAEVSGLVRQYVAPLLQAARALAKTLAGQPQPVHYPAMPVVVKTPAFPLVCQPVAAGKSGTWHYDGSGSNRRALCYAEDNSLLGFVLAGNTVREKMSLCKQLPPLLDATPAPVSQQ